MQLGFSRRGLPLICLAGACWAFSFGVASQLATHWLKDQHAGERIERIIGFNHATYYLGLMLGSLLSSRLIRQWNVLWTVTGLLGCAVSLVLFPTGGAAGWFVWRLINGLASSLSLLPLEAFVSQGSADGERSWNFGVFNGCLAIGVAFGVAVGLTVYEAGSTAAFLLGAVPLLFAALALRAGREALVFQATDRTAAGSAEALDWRGNFLSFGTAWIQGFLEGGMLAFVALYLERSLAMSEELTGILIGVTLVGVIVVQVPVGWLADRYGRVPALLTAYAIIIGGLIWLPWCRSPATVGFWLCALGAATGALYPLGLSLLGDRVPPRLLVRAYSTYLALDCIGSQVGAAAMGEARDRWGENAMFGAGLAAIGLVLATSLLLSRLRRSQAAAEQAAPREAA